MLNREKAMGRQAAPVVVLALLVPLLAAQRSVAAPVLSVAQGSTAVAKGSTYTFPSTTPVGTPTSVLFTINNTGNASLNLTNASSLVSGTAFFEIATPTTPVAAGGSTSVRVRLQSGIPGTFTGTVSIASNDPVNPTFTFTIQGTVTGPVISVQQGSTQVAKGSTYVFPSSTPIGIPVSVLFTISNTGTAALNLSNATTLVSGNAAFSEIATPTTPVAAGGSTTFRVRLQGGSAGTFSGTVTISSDDPVNPTFSFTVQGTVTGPVISVQQGSVQVAKGATYVFPSSTPIGVPVSVLFTISNTGASPLNLSNATALVSGNAAFSEIASPTTPVAAGGTTTFRVRLQGGAAGTFTATVAIASDDPVNPTFSFTVQGTVTGSTISVQQGSGQIAKGSTYTFPASTPVDTATSVLFTISNTGTAPLNISNATTLVSGSPAFSEIATPATPVAVGGSTTFRVRLLASGPGTYSGTVTIASDDAVNPTFTFTVQGTVTGPSIEVLQGSAAIMEGSLYVFPASTPVGIPTSVVFTITNIGNAPLDISNATALVSGTGFSEIATPSTPVAVNASTTFRVRLQAGSPGTYNGTVTIASSDPGNPSFTFSIQGVVSATPTISVLQGSTVWAAGVPYSFGSTPAGVPVSTVFTITNAGQAPLTLTNPTTLVSGTGFSEIANPTATTLNPGASTTFRVRFQAGTPGSYSGTISIGSNDPVTPAFSFPITGTATAAAAISVAQGTTAIANGGSFTFPAATLTGVPETVTFTITNSGSAPLHISNGASLVSGAGFSESASPITPVAAGTSTSFGVQAQASTANTYTGTVTIASDDPLNGTYTFTVTATVSPAPHLRVVQAWNNVTVVPGGTVTFPDTATGTAESLQLLLVNDGPGTLTIGNPSSLVSGACYSELAPAPGATVAAGQSASVRVRLQCGSDQLATGTFSVSSNDPATPTYSFNLSGASGLTLPPLSVVSGDGVSISQQGTYAFPDTALGQQVTRGFTVTNNGGQPFTIANPTSLVSEDPAFSETAAPANNVIAPGGTQSFRVGLQSSQTGAHYGQVTIASADPTQKPFLFGVTGTVQPPDFTLAVTPTSRNLVQGQNVGYTITTASLFGFSSNLTLGETGLDGSSSATFTPATIAAGGSSQLRVYTSAGTPVGTQTLTITATGGGVTHTVTVTLTVTAAPVTTLTVTVSPAQQAVTPGGSAIYTVAVNGANLTSTVALTVTTPSGITGTFDSASLLAGETANLTLTADPSLATGSYPFTVTGTLGALTSTAGGSLAVQAAGSPAAPSITAISPNVIVNGRVTTATVMGQNLAGAAVTIPTAQALPNQPIQRVFPGVTVLSTSADGTSMQVSIDATNSGTMDFYNLAAANSSGQSVGQFRVLPPGPVVDNLSPDDAPAGSISLMSLVGAHLRNTTVTLTPASAAYITNLDTTEDDRTNGLLFVAAGLPVTTVTLTVTDAYGQSYSTNITLGGADGNAQSAPARAVATLPGLHGAKTNIYFRPFRMRRPDATRVVRPGVVIEDLTAAPARPNDDFSVSFTFSATFSLFNYHWQTVILQNPVTGVVGSQALQQLAIGQTTYLAAYVLSAYVEVDATVYWNIDLSGDFTFPEFCFSFVIGGEIPGQTNIPGTFNYAICGGGSGTGSTTGSTGNVSISADNTCAQVTQQDLEDGTAFAAVTQNMCCNQPISVSGSGTTFVGTYFESSFDIDEGDAITTTPAPAACTCPCSFTAQNSQVVIQPGGQMTLNATLTNASNDSCTYNWTLSQTDGNLGLSVNTKGITQPLAGGQSVQVQGTLALPNGAPATDSGTVLFVATPVGQSGGACSAIQSICAIPSSESSTFDQFYNICFDEADFGATLSPASTDFTGRSLTESLSSTFDNCYALEPANDKWPPFNPTPGAWTASTYTGHPGANLASSQDLYGADTIGANTKFQLFVPQQSCTRGATQQMQINCPWGPVNYKTNQFLMSVTPQATTISRDNASGSHLADPTTCQH